METKIHRPWLWPILFVTVVGLGVLLAGGLLWQSATAAPISDQNERPVSTGILPIADPVEAQSLQELVSALHAGQAEHADQTTFTALVQAGQIEQAFEEAFETGDKIFETRFNAVDGVGAHVGQGLRFSQIPRADLNGPQEWANHTPRRITGPNAEACNECHGTPMDDGAGPAINDNVRDPLHSGDLSLFIQRNTPHLFGAGAVQRLAEEMTEQLQAQQAQAMAQACADNQTITVELTAKGISFGALTAQPGTGESCVALVDTIGVAGVNPDLVVRPFQWKGVNSWVREFNRDASHQELGMQAVEIVGEGVDGDFDGVVNEFTVGDQTAMAVYVAAQPRPTSLLELDELGLTDPLSTDQKSAIRRGMAAFAQIGCTACHTAQMTLADPTYSEPSRNPNYRDALFPAGQDPVSLGLDPNTAIHFDLTQDQPDNQILQADGEIYRLGSLASNSQGEALVQLYGDLKRHDMGPDLAETIDDEGIPATVFLTENLWGVGSTAPYLHDGRATTLAEAILAHGGEAAAARQRFTGLNSEAQVDVIAFLQNLVLYKGNGAATPSAQVQAVTAAAIETVSGVRIESRTPRRNPGHAPRRPGRSLWDRVWPFGR